MFAHSGGGVVWGSLEREVVMAEDLVVVETVQGAAHEEQLLRFLAANGIEASVQGEALRHTHGFTLDGLGAVRVLVPAAQAEAARELLARVHSGELELAEDELPAESEGGPG